MNTVVASISSKKILFSGTNAQCAWFIDVKGIDVYDKSVNGEIIWVK